MNKHVWIHWLKNRFTRRGLLDALAVTAIVSLIASVSVLANGQTQLVSVNLAGKNSANGQSEVIFITNAVPNSKDTPTPTMPPTPTPTDTPTAAQTQTRTPTSAPTASFTLASISQVLPDLTISAMRIELQNTSCFTPDDMLGVRVWVTNIGQAAAGNFVVRVNGVEQMVYGLEIGETQAVFFPGYSNPVTAIVDSTGAIAESNENNNTRSEILPIPTAPLPCPTPTFTPTLTPTPTPIPSACDLYPIALHIDSLNGIAVGDIIPDIYNGSRSGNFGWLSWAGASSQGTLANSLIPPGDSDTYVNPDDPNDHIVSVSDKIQGRPGVANSRDIRQALDALSDMDIIVPIWDAVERGDNNVLYHVMGFARARLTSYHLPGENQISAQFLGLAACE